MMCIARGPDTWPAEVVTLIPSTSLPPRDLAARPGPAPATSWWMGRFRTASSSRSAAARATVRSRRPFRCGGCGAPPRRRARGYQRHRNDGSTPGLEGRLSGWRWGHWDSQRWWRRPVIERARTLRQVLRPADHGPHTPGEIRCARNDPHLSPLRKLADLLRRPERQRLDRRGRLPSCRGHHTFSSQMKRLRTSWVRWVASTKDSFASSPIRQVPSMWLAHEVPRPARDRRPPHQPPAGSRAGPAATGRWKSSG